MSNYYAKEYLAKKKTYDALADKCQVIEEETSKARNAYSKARDGFRNSISFDQLTELAILAAQEDVRNEASK